MDMMTTTEVAEYLGIQYNSVSTTLRNLGITAVARQPGRDGQNLYDRAQVEEVHGRRPGPGNWGGDGGWPTRRKGSPDAER